MRANLIFDCILTLNLIANTAIFYPFNVGVLRARRVSF